MTRRSSNILPILAWDQAYNRNGDRKLPRTAMNVIRTYVDNKTLRGWVKQETLAEATGLDVRSVKRQIRANIDAGWVRVTDRGNSSGWANTYELTIPEMVTQMSPTRGHVCHLEGDTDVTPTTPRTTPRTTNITTPRDGDTDVTIGASAEEAMGSGDPLEETTAGLSPSKGTSDGHTRNEVPSWDVTDDWLSPSDDNQKPSARVSRETGSPIGSSGEPSEPSPLEVPTMGNTSGSSARPCGASPYASCKKDPFVDDHECSTHDVEDYPTHESYRSPSRRRPKCFSSSCRDSVCDVHGGFSNIVPF